MSINIANPGNMFDDFLEKLESIDQAEEVDTSFNDFFYQFTADLADDHRDIIEADRIKQIEAKESDEKYYSSYLTKAVGLMVFQAMQEPDNFESYKIPQAVADALIRLDNAAPTDPVSVFGCRTCGFSIDCVLLKEDADRFGEKCPACGGRSRINYLNIKVAVAP